MHLRFLPIFSWLVARHISVLKTIPLSVFKVTFSFKVWGNVPSKLDDFPRRTGSSWEGPVLFRNQEKASHRLFCNTGACTYRFCPFFSSQELHEKRRSGNDKFRFPQKSLHGLSGPQAGPFSLASQTAGLELSRPSEEVCTFLGRNWLVQAHMQGHPLSAASGLRRTLQ